MIRPQEAAAALVMIAPRSPAALCVLQKLENQCRQCHHRKGVHFEAVEFINITQPGNRCLLAAESVAAQSALSQWIIHGLFSACQSIIAGGSSAGAAGARGGGGGGKAKSQYDLSSCSVPIAALSALWLKLRLKPAACIDLWTCFALFLIAQEAA